MWRCCISLALTSMGRVTHPNARFAKLGKLKNWRKCSTPYLFKKAINWLLHTNINLCMRYNHLLKCHNALPFGTKDLSMLNSNHPKINSFLACKITLRKCQEQEAILRDYDIFSHVGFPETYIQNFPCSR